MHRSVVEWQRAGRGESVTLKSGFTRLTWVATGCDKLQVDAVPVDKGMG